MSKRSTEKSSATRLPGPERKREILAAAREVFSAQGYENTSVADIASRVGIVEGAVYKHFPTKRDLLFEGMCTFYRPIIDETREQLAGVRGARNRLRFLIWRQLRGFAEEPGICRLIIQDIRPRQDYPESVVHELNRESTSLALGVIEDGIRRGEFRADIPAAMVRDLIFGGIEHIAWKVLSGRAELDIDKIADDLTEVVLGGLAAGGGRETASEPVFERERERLQEQIERLERAVAGLEGGAAGVGDG